MRAGLALAFAFTLAACAREPAAPPSALIENPPESAQPVALEILRHLAAGEVEQAARLSNAPQRRLEVLREYRARVGEEEFKRVFREYLSPENRVVAEIGLGHRRLLVWRLASAEGAVVGQYYVLSDGRFVMDDEPSRERAGLSKVLTRYRSLR